jgi:predicted RNA-binding protein associated with RNAse of E/G family
VPRNPGSVVDIEGRRVFDRDRVWYPLERFVLADAALYYGPPISGNRHFYYHERWLLPEHSWSISRFSFHDNFKDRVDWYIETDLIDITANLWRVRDCYLDVAVIEGARYEVWDADELAEGMTRGEIPHSEVAIALEALHRVCQALAENGYSGSALLAEFAPALPR